jgi:ribosomal protein L37AE/L43A
MVYLLPQCIRYGSPVADSIESEIEEHEKVKLGRYNNGVWTCNDCMAASQGQENEEQQQDTIGIASKSDVSPNTPRADEAGL